MDRTRVGAVADVSNTAPAPVAAPRRRTAIFWMALLIALGWLATLAWLTWTTANPVTLNRQQIFRSDYVLAAKVLQLKPGRVQRVSDPDLWLLDAPAELTVAELSAAGAQVGQVYLIPLSRTPDGRWEVTPTRLPNGQPLIYLATPESQAQLQALRAEQRPQFGAAPSVPTLLD